MLKENDTVALIGAELAWVIANVGNHWMAKTDNHFCRIIGLSCEGDILLKTKPGIAHEMFGIVVCDKKIVSRIEHNRIAAALDFKGLNRTAVVTKFGIDSNIATYHLNILTYKMLAELDSIGITPDADQADFDLGMVIYGRGYQCYTTAGFWIKGFTKWCFGINQEVVE